MKDGSKIVNSTRALYSPKTVGTFMLEELPSSASLIYTVQVFTMSTIVIGTAIGSFNFISPTSDPSNDYTVNCMFVIINML